MSLLSTLEAVNEAPARAGAYYGKVLNPVQHHQSNLSKAAEAIQKAGERWHVNPAYIWGIYGTETSFGSNIKASSAGAVGPFQFLPSTAREYGYPLGVNEHAITDWGAFQKQADAAARYLYQHGGQHNPNAAVRAYNPGSSSYLGEVLEHAKSFHVSFASEAANKAEKENIEKAEPKKGSGIVEEIFSKLGGFALTGILLLAGAVLVIYGILVAVRPREHALSIPGLPAVA